MRSVGGGTRVYAVLGHPVGHSLSPRLQNAAFEAAGLDAVYVALDVPPDRFDAALDGLHAAGVLGLNVTLPHKEAAFARLAGATDAARAAGAANTLRRRDEGWEGDATDGAGFLAWAAELGIALEGARVILLGAGGAARSVGHALLTRGAGTVRVVSRDGARAEALAATLTRAGRHAGRVEPAALGAPAGGSDPYDLLIRAIPEPSVLEVEAPLWRALDPAAPVLDLNYGERAAETRARAAREGRRMEDGLGLLLHQGAASFTFWTGIPAPIEAMRRAIGA
ncbi:MAG: shikimate dehydrogenase family protein [Hyphomicrobiales bacterium]